MNNSSADLMLNVQQSPWSVGNFMKMDEHGSCLPFHEQYLRIDFSPSISGITLDTSEIKDSNEIF